MYTQHKTSIFSQIFKPRIATQSRCWCYTFVESLWHECACAVLGCVSVLKLGRLIFAAVKHACFTFVALCMRVMLLSSVG